MDLFHVGSARARSLRASPQRTREMRYARPNRAGMMSHGSRLSLPTGVRSDGKGTGIYCRHRAPSHNAYNDLPLPGQQASAARSTSYFDLYLYSTVPRAAPLQP
jgi:hypothetical protein